jgi:hypothetical protein
MVVQLAGIPEKLRLGNPMVFGRLRLTPMYLAGDSPLEYVLYDDTGADGLVEICEVSKSGSVPELIVRNRAKVRLLLLDGTTLVGSKQNRVVNVSILLAPESETVIPVSCVERGRWSFATRQSSPSEHVDKELRRAMCADATAGLAEHGKIQVSQSGVWCHVDMMLKGSGAASPTQAYHAVYEKYDEQLGNYQNALTWQEGSAGVAVELDGQIETIELFDKADTLRRLWPRLIRSYAVGAIGHQAAGHNPCDSNVVSFLARSLRCEVAQPAPLGAGVSVRLVSPDSVGAALVSEGHVVHLSLFANRKRSDIGAVGEAQGPTDALSHQPPAHEQHRRPWWRFWT